MTIYEVKATVIIAAWCAEDTLDQSIGSALAQDVEPLEVIVVDDASPDETTEVASKWMSKDPRVRVLQLDRNGGPSAARNAAFDVARGRWLAVLDSDDRMRPGRLSEMIAFAERSGADCVYDDLQSVDPEGNITGPSHLASLSLKEPQAWTLERFLAGCTAKSGQAALGYLKPVLRHSFVKEHGLRYDVSLRNGEDFHLIAELLASGGVLWFMPQVGYLYTRRVDSVSNRLDLRHAQKLADSDTAFRLRHADKLSVAAKRLLRIRQRNLANLTTAERVLRALKERRVRDALFSLYQRPVATLRLMQQLYTGLARRWF